MQYSAWCPRFLFDSTQSRSGRCAPTLQRLKFAGQHQVSDLPTVRAQLEALVRLVFAETRKWLHDRSNDAYNELFEKLIRVGLERGEFTVASPEITLRFINGISVVVVLGAAVMLTTTPSRSAPTRSE